MQLVLVTIIVILLLLIARHIRAEHLWLTIPDRAEHYAGCSSCPSAIVDGGYTVLNPYVYPYSATTCIDTLYRAPKPDFLRDPVFFPSVPDHVEKV